MTNINYIANYAPTALQTGTKLQTNTANAALFQSMLQSHQAKSAFGIGSVGTKTVIASPFQVSAVTPASTSANISENWCISDYYKMPPTEVQAALSEVRQEIADADFADMTDIEIYDWIENKFIEKFGKDFVMACALDVLDPNVNGLPWNGIACNNYQNIGSAFYRALDEQFTDKYRDNAYGLQGNVFTIVNRERLYGDMSTEDIMDTIRAKYPPNDKLTNRDVCLMLHEMAFVGVHNCTSLSGDYKRLECTPKDADGRLMHEPSGEEMNRLWIELLDKPFNVGILNAMNNHNMRTGGDSDLHVLSEREFLINYLGATVGPDGFLLPDDWLDNGTMGAGSLDFDITVPDLLSEFIKYLDEHDRELARIREGRSADKNDMDMAELLSGEDSTTQDNTISDASAFL